MAEVRQGLRQEVATAQFKCHLLEKKGKRGEEAIEYLVNKIDKGKIAEVCERMRAMGIQVDMRGHGGGKEGGKEGAARDLKERPKLRAGFIYIDEEHSNL